MTKHWHSLPARSSRVRSGGFTLLEIMIALVIGAIVISVALPTFMGSIRKGRRSEAMTALTALQQEQERWRSNNRQYTNVLSNLRISSPTSPGRYYVLTITDPTDTGYTAVADGSGSTQVGDGNCAKLAVKLDRGSITYASCTGCADTALVFDASNTCWSR